MLNNIESTQELKGNISLGVPIQRQIDALKSRNQAKLCAWNGKKNNYKRSAKVNSN